LAVAFALDFLGLRFGRVGERLERERFRRLVQQRQEPFGLFKIGDQVGTIVRIVGGCGKMVSANCTTFPPRLAGLLVSSVNNSRAGIVPRRVLGVGIQVGACVTHAAAKLAEARAITGPAPAVQSVRAQSEIIGGGLRREKFSSHRSSS